MTDKDDAQLFRMAIVTSVGTGTVKVKFDDEEESSGKDYRYIMTGSAPLRNSRVLMARMSGTYICIGRVYQ